MDAPEPVRVLGWERLPRCPRAEAFLLWFSRGCNSCEGRGSHNNTGPLGPKKRGSAVGMRVLLVHTDVVGGGLPNVVTTLARLLPAEHKALCYSPRPEREPTPEVLQNLTACGNRLYRIDHRVLSLRYLTLFREVLREFRPDVVHLHGTTFALIGAAARLWLPRPPVWVFTQHTELQFDAGWLVKLAKPCTRRMDHVVCVSEAIRQHFVAIYGARWVEEKASVIRNGIETALLDNPPDAEERRRLRSSIGLTDEDIAVGCLGLLRKVKGQHVLVEAVASLLGRYPRLRLVLIGSGDEEAALVELADALGVRQQVSLLGWRTDAQALLPALDIYVQPSLSEGLPIALLEAGAAGLPSVATSAGGMGEVIVEGETGLLVAPGDAAALAGALTRLIDDPELGRRLGANARAMVAEEFTAHTMIERHMELYLSLLAKTGSDQG